MELAITIFLGLWFTAAGAVAAYFVFRDYKIADNGKKQEDKNNG